MTAADPLAWLTELDKAHAKATPGEWRYDPREPRTVRDSHPRLPAALITFRDPGADAALIVAAVNAVPRLTAAVRAALALADELDADAADQCGPLRDRIRDTADRLRATVTAALTGEGAGQ